MKAKIVKECGYDTYFAIEISDLRKTVNGKNEIIFRLAKHEYSNDVDMISLFNEIVDKINKGENK